ncbi:MarR family transcriptional regulator [Neisseriaceae bacterium PsAf]|nr:MarR family transcriptional regulator [Neisseriaceae bacterium PsAf]MCV2502537.1 MarR family transcriptional regulator [Neisseriaceae bacterium]
MNSDNKQIGDFRFPNLVALVSRTWRKTLDNRLQDYNLTEATWLPLVYLARLDGPIRQKELASMLSLDDSSVVRILNNLEKLNLIKRTIEEKDRRAKAIIITNKGREITTTLENISKSLEHEIRKNLNPEDFETSKQVLLEIYQILNSINQKQT